MRKLNGHATSSFMKKQVYTVELAVGHKKNLYFLVLFPRHTEETDEEEEEDEWETGAQTLLKEGARNRTCELKILQHTTLLLTPSFYVTICSHL